MADQPAKPKIARHWIGAGLAVAFLIMTVPVLRSNHQLVRQGRARIASSHSSDTEYKSDLLADAFKSAADRQEPYRPFRKGELKFNKQIASIIYGKCAACHNAGGVAPFQLTSFSEVRKRARRIEQAVSRRSMPPWLPDNCSPEFLGNASLTNEERGMVEQWLVEGCREGDRRNAPPAPKSLPEWPYGPPDAVLQPAQAYQVPAEGPDIHRCFVIPTNYSEDRFVDVVDVMPGSAKAVHHVLLYTNTSGVARELDAAEPGPGFSMFGALGFDPKSQLGLLVRGISQRSLPEGVGYFLPKGADIVMHVHYHPTGKEETDLTRIALYFCNKPVEKQLRCMAIAIPPRVLRIPAGDSDAVFWAEQEMPGDISVIQIKPHMHLLAREIAAAATLPDGSVVPLLRISNWDFRWQNTYAFKTPIRLPKGSRVRIEARFDNSTANPHNPNEPPRFVHFGRRTVDEMCFLYLFYTVDSEKLTVNQRAPAIYPDSFLSFNWGRLVAGRKQKLQVALGNR